MIPSTTHANGRRASSTICATTSGSRTISAVNRIATSPRCRACGVPRIAPSRRHADVDRIIRGPRHRLSAYVVRRTCYRVLAKPLGNPGLAAGRLERQDSRARIEHLRLAHHQARMVEPTGRITGADPARSRASAAHESGWCGPGDGETWQLERPGP